MTYSSVAYLNMLKLHILLVKYFVDVGSTTNAEPHLCEQSFSKMLNLKMKRRQKFCIETDMRVVFVKAKPCISELASQSPAKVTLIRKVVSL